MANLDNFVTELCSLLTELNFNKTVAFFDKNFAASEKYVILESKEFTQNCTLLTIALTIIFNPIFRFTALGSIYFLHESLNNVDIYDFQVIKNSILIALTRDEVGYYPKTR